MIIVLKFMISLVVKLENIRLPLAAISLASPLCTLNRVSDNPAAYKKHGIEVRCQYKLADAVRVSEVSTRCE